MTAEIINELAVLKDLSEVTSEQVLLWAMGTEAQKSSKAILGNVKEMKEFDMLIKKSKNKTEQRQTSTKVAQNLQH